MCLKSSYMILLSLINILHRSLTNCLVKINKRILWASFVSQWTVSLRQLWVWCKVSGCLNDQIHRSTSWHSSLQETSLSLWVQMKLYSWQCACSSSDWWCKNTRAYQSHDSWNREVWEMCTCTVSSDGKRESVPAEKWFHLVRWLWIISLWAYRFL